MTVGSIVGGGFRLIREHPGAVAVWGLLYLAATFGMALLMRPVFGDSPGTSGDSALAAAADLSPMLGVLLPLFQLLLLVLPFALLAASQRAVLEPDSPGFAYLRLGLDELRFVGLTLVLAVIFYVGLLVAMVAMTLVVATAAAVAGPAWATPLAYVEVIGLVAAGLWLQVRLSLAFPLTLLRDRMAIGEAWWLSGRRFWTLLGAYVLIFLILLALWTLAALATSWDYLAEMARSGFAREAVEAAGERQMAKYLGEISASGVAGWIVTSAVSSLSIALLGGAVATAARELTDDFEAFGENFA